MAARMISSIAMPKELWEAVERLADAQDTSRSRLIERWIREKIEGEKQMVALLGNPVVGRRLAQMFSDPDVLRQLVAALGEKLDDKQLMLFEQGIRGIQGEAEKLTQRKAAPRRPRRKGGGK